MSLQTVVLAGVTVAAIALAGFLGYKAYGFRAQLTQTQAALSTATSSLAEVSSTLAQTRADNLELSDALDRARQQNEDYLDKIQTLNHSVDVLHKLTSIDPELLAKYSKVYFLSDTYVPAKIATITPEFGFEKDRTYRFEGDALPFLEDLLSDANSNNVHLLVASAYRSFGEQSDLKASYRFTYGAGTANSFSADQGYSEHQLGTAVDFTTAELAGNFSGFAASDAYAWLNENAYKYGFVISYPKGNGYYTSEPWHWRFVGKKLALELHKQNAYFYTLDQRTIDSYLIYLFDR